MARKEIKKYTDSELKTLAKINLIQKGEYFTRYPKMMDFFEAGNISIQRALFGSNRSGKTTTGKMETAYHLIGNYPEWWNGVRFEKPISALCASVDSMMVYENLFCGLFGDPKNPNDVGLIPPYLVKESFKEPNATLPTVLVRHKSGGYSKVRFRTYTSGREAHQGVKYDFVLLDEEPTIELYNEILTRIASENDTGRLILCACPLNGMTPLMATFYKGLTKKREVTPEIYFDTIAWSDVTHLGNGTKASLKTTYSDAEMIPRTTGEPTESGSQVYPVSTTLVSIDPFEVPEFWPRCYGLDFGWSPHPTTLAIMARDPASGTIYVIGEYAATERTAEAHAYHTRHFHIDQVPIIIDDSGATITAQGQGKSLMELFRNAGFNHLYRADKAHKDASIQYIIQLFNKNQLKIFKTCKRLLEEIQLHRRDENGKIIKTNDDLLDAMRYGIYSGFKKNIARPINQKIGKNNVNDEFFEPTYL